MEWQHQARLMLRVPGMRCHDVQILVGSKIIEAEQLAGMQVDDVLTMIAPFVSSATGQWIIRSGKVPDHDEVSEWIQCAQQARSVGVDVRKSA